MGCRSLVAAAVLMLSFTSSVSALPFNEDMVGSQEITGKIMRPKAPDSVPYGSLGARVESRDDALKLENPLKNDPLSTANGERLFSINCTPCHGRWVDDKHMKSTLPTMPSMDLTLPNYKEKTDGYIYATIHFGSLTTLMPPYGWKLSPREHWDIINYIRKMQAEMPK